VPQNERRGENASMSLRISGWMFLYGYAADVHSELATFAPDVEGDRSGLRRLLI
jgi:hypothetical protein